jgi:hypothetical protein
MIAFKESFHLEGGELIRQIIFGLNTEGISIFAFSPTPISLASSSRKQRGIWWFQIFEVIYHSCLSTGTQVKVIAELILNVCCDVVFQPEITAYFEFI